MQVAIVRVHGTRQAATDGDAAEKRQCRLMAAYQFIGKE